MPSCTMAQHARNREDCKDLPNCSANENKLAVELNLKKTTKKNALDFDFT